MSGEAPATRQRSAVATPQARLLGHLADRVGGVPTETTSEGQRRRGGGERGGGEGREC